MTHPTPDLLALLALEEHVDPEVLDQVAGCRACGDEVEVLQQLVHIGRSPLPGGALDVPHARVWQRVAQNVSLGPRRDTRPARSTTAVLPGRLAP